MTGSLAGKVALVTGAASGIGKATARLLLEQGAQVASLDRQAGYGDGPALIADIAEEAQVVAAFAELDRSHGAVDILVNCAGMMVERPLLEMSGAEFDRTIAVNLRGSFLVGREAIRRMRDQGRSGRVINVASDLAHIGRADYSAYCASKAGVIGLTRSWAHEFAPEILINAVAPGPVDTPLLDPAKMSPAVLASESDNPLGRIGKPQEIASVIAFLAGPGADFITGQTFGPNGGSVMT